MSLFHIFLIAALQGVTEFLPVSSSGHLILLPSLTALPDQGQAIDVAVHVGTLGAVLLYFWSDFKLAVGGIPKALSGRWESPGAKLASLLAIATVPVVVAGLFIKLTGLDDVMRSVTVIGWTMLGFGIVLWIADRSGVQEKKSDEWSVRDAWVIGLWQALALIPGTSRSGAAISGARALGYKRTDSAKIAMLMSIPTIIASGVPLGYEVIGNADVSVARDGAIAASFAFVAALIALRLMMRLLQSVSFTPYVIYRIILGVVLLVYAYT
ncbi:undecaprenyl-diphosphate phosphatase [Pseudopelagicola sp. nBUS_19]|uniref:undecaprenyl-diphosphate phosphatase n=1 Tax=Pseudopelagicola sp. nBUS_19 TaxID=3395316 RepID=UPI003EBCD2A7